MMQLYWCEIADGIPMPDFGGEFRAHIGQKTHPDGLRRSCAAWKLLEMALRERGFASLPQVHFSESGKPCFADAPLHFSLSHSGSLAAVMLADTPCGVDIEEIRPGISEKLYARCMHPEEIQSGVSFFETWTKKECIGKLSGDGMPAHPKAVNTLDAQYSGSFFSCRIVDSTGNKYMLSALCKNAAHLNAEKRTIIKG